MPQQGVFRAQLTLLAHGLQQFSRRKGLALKALLLGAVLAIWCAVLLGGRRLRRSVRHCRRYHPLAAPHVAQPALQATQRSRQPKLPVNGRCRVALRYQGQDFSPVGDDLHAAFSPRRHEKSPNDCLRKKVSVIVKLRQKRSMRIDAMTMKDKIRQMFHVHCSICLFHACRHFHFNDRVG